MNDARQLSTIGKPEPLTARPLRAGIGTKLTLAGALFWVLIFLGQGLALIGANAQTFDEAVHLAAGYAALVRGNFQLNWEDPPLIKELSALPVYLKYRIPFDYHPDFGKEGEDWRVGRDFLYRSSVPHDQILALGRMPNLVLGAVLVGLIGWWAYRLWGRGAALVGMGLAALDPNLVAHASVVTTDLGITLFTFLTLYLLWEYVAAPSRWLLTAVGISLGLALATKFSALILVGIIGVVIGLHVLGGGSFADPGAEPKGPGEGLGPRLAEAISPACRILLWALAVVPLFYFIHGFPFWAKGLRLQLTRPARGHLAFFLGAHSHQGWWTYFPVAFLIKTPIGTLLLILAGLALYWAGTRLGRRDVLFLGVPPALFCAVMAWGRINIGLRYILPISPFLLVLASRLATVRTLGGRTGRWVCPLLVGLPLALTAASALRAAPHQLAYFNELVGGPAEGYRYLGDSNLDWGQDLKGLKAYMDREGLPMIYLSYFGTAPPAAYGIRYQYVPGFGLLDRPSPDLLPPRSRREILAISVTNLQGIFLPRTDLYRWLDCRTPVKKIGSSIYVYDLTGDADAHLRLAQAYLAAGPPQLAAPELQKVLALDPAKSEAARLLRVVGEKPSRYRPYRRPS